ncbi:hypothetical protein EON63_19025 [archaeon]|nr:MAG: hypothetical protein EON63_19025 [archaeon]
MYGSCACNGMDMYNVSMMGLGVCMVHVCKCVDVYGGNEHGSCMFMHLGCPCLLVLSVHLLSLLHDTH